MTKQRRLSNCY